MNISVVVIGAQFPGNLGAIARSMANFTAKDLYLIEPLCDHLAKEAQDRASHAKEILHNAKIVTSLVDIPTDLLLATSAQTAQVDYNIVRVPLSLQHLKQQIQNKHIGEKYTITIVLGRESSGLTNEEIQQCDLLTTIPTSTSYPVMNQSHAATVLLYELAQLKQTLQLNKQHQPENEQKNLNESNAEFKEEQDILCPKKEREQLYSYIQSTLDEMDFSTLEKKETQEKIFKRLLAKSFVTKREAMALFSYFKNVRALQTKNNFDKQE